MEPYEKQLEKRNWELQERLEAALIENEKLSNHQVFLVKLYTTIRQDDDNNKQFSSNFPFLVGSPEQLLNKTFVKFLTMNAIYKIACEITEDKVLGAYYSNYSESVIGKEKHKEFYDIAESNIKATIRDFISSTDYLEREMGGISVVEHKTDKKRIYISIDIGKMNCDLKYYEQLIPVSTLV